MNNRKLVLENGQVFYGVGFGSLNEVVAEVIYNTAVVGYQEIISDPTNCKKIVCMTYPLIGNYGLTDEDYESKHIDVSGLIVRDYNEQPSNFRYTRTLSEVLEENSISGISGIDTRQLMKVIRDVKSMKALICDINKDMDECLEIINNYNEPENLVQMVTSKKVWYSRTANQVCNIVIIDLGTKLNYIKRLNELGCNVIIVPANTTKEEILKYKPDGLFISSGPGNPDNIEGVINIVKELIGVKPILGVGLGSLVIAKAYGVNILRMNGGHHGSNYPVRNIITNKIDITTQNHIYTVDENSLENTSLQVSHRNVITNEVEGLIDVDSKVIGIEYEPTLPIDCDSEDVYINFLEMIKAGGKKNA